MDARMLEVLFGGESCAKRKLVRESQHEAARIDLHRSVKSNLSGQQWQNSQR
jgi:hypothetical protein